MKFSRYQFGRHWPATRLNSCLLASYLSNSAKSVVDIGCNEGAYTCLLSSMGLNVTGIEGDKVYFNRACKLSRAMGLRPNLLNTYFTIESARSMSCKDACVILSVHHQMVQANGFDYANELLREMGRKSRQLFFQPACIGEKYKCKVPFRDNDLYSVIHYFETILADLFPYNRVVGLVPNDIPKSEPLRPMLLFSQEPIELQSGKDVVELVGKLAKYSRSRFRFPITARGRLSRPADDRIIMPQAPTT